MSVFPLSVGGVHSRATLKPQVSAIFTLAGGPGSSAKPQRQKKVGNKKTCVSFTHVDLKTETLTDNLQGDDGLVLKVIHLYAHFVVSRVLSFGGADEQDAVSVRATDVHPLGFQGLPIL